jgi:hypothetical protein
VDLEAVVTFHSAAAFCGNGFAFCKSTPIFKITFIGKIMSN